MPIRYTIKLTEDERKQLTSITSKPSKCQAKLFTNARILLLCDAAMGKPSRSVADIATVLGVTSRTIEHLKRRFVEDGLEAALGREHRTRLPGNLKFDGEVEARIIALVESPAPEGNARWTMRLLARKVVEFGIVPSISAMTVQRLLKKRNLTLTI